MSRPVVALGKFKNQLSFLENLLLNACSRKSSAGYNLNGLFVGSEGTLGIVTEVTLKLAPLPEATAVAVVSFQSMRAAAQAAVSVVRRGIPINCVEILDDVQMSVINRVGNTDRVWKEAPTLFFKFAGSKGIVKESIAEVSKVIKEHGGSDFEFSKDEQSQKKLWSARKEALWSMLSLRTSGTGVWSTDVAVPLSRIADLIGEHLKPVVPRAACRPLTQNRNMQERP